MFYNMLYKIFKSTAGYLTASVSARYKDEFNISINKTNLFRAKITSICFIILETVILIVSYKVRGERFFRSPGVYYQAMYLILLSSMILYLCIFLKLQKNIPNNNLSIKVAGISFSSLILLWCAGISLLDQLSNGQVMVYTVAMIFIAITPYIEPLTLLAVYVPIHVLFLYLLPLFNPHGTFFGSYINSTSFLVISWAISCMRYQKQIEDFNIKQVIHEKNIELMKINKDLELAKEQLQKLSQTDSLTGICNRFMFDRTIKAEWDRCKRHSIPLSLIMIDVDFFKAYNDQYGHQNGDECLRKVADVLLTSIRRSSDVVARYGGEEFAIILPHMKKEKTYEFAEQVRKLVETMEIPHDKSLVSGHVTISVGVCTVIPSNRLTVEEFIRNTDKALYKAKKTRNNIIVA